MAKIFGQEFSKKELLRRVGSIDTLAGVKLMEYGAGRAKGMGVYEVTNGELRFTLNIDKCLDMGELCYRGMPLNFLSRPGEMGPLWYSDGPNAPRSITCGMFFTCGFSNVGPLQTSDTGRTLPQHGYSRTSPARLHGATTAWHGDELDITVTGEVREASLFGENVVLRRSVTTRLGERTITVRDEIENENVTEAPLMLMYHCNTGFPFLDASAYAIFDATETRCRDAVAEAGLKREDCRVFGEPIDGFEEEVFYHRLRPQNGMCYASVVNPGRKLGLKIGFDPKELPNLIQWKCKASGDYVMAMEPSNCYPEGQAAQKAYKALRMLAPGEIIHTELSFTVCEGEDYDRLVAGK